MNGNVWIWKWKRGSCGSFTFDHLERGGGNSYSKARLAAFGTDGRQFLAIRKHHLRDTVNNEQRNERPRTNKWKAIGPLESNYNFRRLFYGVNTGLNVTFKWGTKRAITQFDIVSSNLTT